MKRFGILASVLAAFLLIAGGAEAATTNTVTNAMGQVATVVIDDYGVVTTFTLSAVNFPASQERGLVASQGAQLDWGGPTTTTNTLFTPRDIGDWLYGFENGTGKVWTAVGVTTSDWSVVVDP
jgi:hypothetical protein